MVGKRPVAVVDRSIWEIPGKIKRYDAKAFHNGGYFQQMIKKKSHIRPVSRPISQPAPAPLSDSSKSLVGVVLIMTVIGVLWIDYRRNLWGTIMVRVMI